MKHRREIFALLAIALADNVRAGVKGWDTLNRMPLAEGRAFGSSGSYTRLSGVVRFAIDPKLPVNRNIADIQLAPLNSNGLVEFSADVCIFQPNDLQKGNGTILLEVVNRGKKGMLGTFNRAGSANSPLSPEDLGDGFLLHSGYTLVWVGWQHDVPSDDALMRLRAPPAKGVKGLVRSEYTPDRPVSSFSLGDAGHVPYPVLQGGKISLSARDKIAGQRKNIPNSGWTVDPMGSVQLSSPATPGNIYEVVYESVDPAIAGLGLAAIRDFISYVKRDYKYAIGFGTSQSAMVLRGLLYEGFNQDENGKMVLDGIFAHVAGARRSTFHRFVQPSRTAGPLRNASFSSTEQFPFSDSDQVDPISGKRDGIRHSAALVKQEPKIFYTNSAYEYWGSAASLLHTTPDGEKDVPVPASTRIYMFAGGQHGPAAFPPKLGAGQNLPNFNNYLWSLRVLLNRLQSWVAKGEQPPHSVYPTLVTGTLTKFENYRFPNLSRVSRPTMIHTPHGLDFGPQYGRAVITKEPPTVLGAYTPLVPQSDASGNDEGGVTMPEISCALGSFTGWNLRSASVGNPQYLLGQTGSYIPFPWTNAERLASGDTRPSVESRFKSQADYVACVERRTADQVQRGFLRGADSDSIKQAAIRHWQWRLQEQHSAGASNASQ